jgi:hypothetical protein
MDQVPFLTHRTELVRERLKLLEALMISGRHQRGTTEQAAGVTIWIGWLHQSNFHCFDDGVSFVAQLYHT